VFIRRHIDLLDRGNIGIKSYTHDAMLSKKCLSAILKCKSTITTRDCSRLIWISEHFLSSLKSSESSQTSTTFASKRGIDDSGSNTSQTSSKRKFVRAWLKDFPWLMYEANRMFCKFCRDNTTCSGSSSTFMSGSQNFKIESVRSHKASTGHTRCVAAADRRSQN